jgi:hypothetical protein
LWIGKGKGRCQVRDTNHSFTFPIICNKTSDVWLQGVVGCIERYKKATINRDKVKARNNEL